MNNKIREILQDAHTNKRNVVLRFKGGSVTAGPGVGGGGSGGPSYTKITPLWSPSKSESPAKQVPGRYPSDSHQEENNKSWNGWKGEYNGNTANAGMAYLDALDATSASGLTGGYGGHGSGRPTTVSAATGGGAYASAPTATGALGEQPDGSFVDSQGSNINLGGDGGSCNSVPLWISRQLP